MKLSKNNIEVTVNSKIGQIASIKFNNEEVIYQGNKVWKGGFPMLFPAVGVSKNSIHNNEKEFLMPKHGYWKNLNWNVFYENENLVLSAISNKNITPFTFDIMQTIKIINNSVQIIVTITNASNEDAYFHFGWHPSFITNNKTRINFNESELANVITTDIKLNKSLNIDLNNKRICDLPFNEKTNTFVFLNTKINNVSLSDDKHLLNLYFSEPNLLIWKNNSDNFICIEPWHGQGDTWFDDYSKELKGKREIIKLMKAKTFKSVYIIEYKKNNKIKSN